MSTNPTATPSLDLEIADEAIFPFWEALCLELNAGKTLPKPALETLRNYFCCMVASLPHHVLVGVSDPTDGTSVSLRIAISDDAKRHFAVVAEDLIAKFDLTHSDFSSGCDDQNLTRFSGEERPSSDDGRGPGGATQ